MFFPWCGERHRFCGIFSQHKYIDANTHLPSLDDLHPFLAKLRSIMIPYLFSSVLNSKFVIEQQEQKETSTDTNIHLERYSFTESSSKSHGAIKFEVYNVSEAERLIHTYSLKMSTLQKSLWDFLHTHHAPPSSLSMAGDSTKKPRIKKSHSDFLEWEKTFTKSQILVEYNNNNEISM